MILLHLFYFDKWLNVWFYFWNGAVQIRLKVNQIRPYNLILISFMLKNTDSHTYQEGNATSGVNTATATWRCQPCIVTQNAFRLFSVKTVFAAESCISQGTGLWYFLRHLESYQLGSWKGLLWTQSLNCRFWSAVIRADARSAVCWGKYWLHF